MSEIPRLTDAEREAEIDALLSEIRVRLADEPALVTRLKRWHRLLGYSCIGASEGMFCCLDLLLETEGVQR